LERKFGIDLAEDIKLDKYALDIESEMTSSILLHWGELYAEAKTELDKAEGNLKSMKAARDLFYRKNPPMDIKTTESVFANLVETDMEVQKAKETVYTWTEKTNRYWAAVDALHDKSAKLHILSDLWQKGYYSNKT
jgi:hypothetical protein